MEKLTHFKIGQIVNTQGLKGEVRVYPFTDDIYRFDDLEEFYLGKDLETKWEVERVRYKGNMVIMKIKNVDRVEDAERLRNKFMYVSREDSRELEEGEFFIAGIKNSLPSLLFITYTSLAAYCNTSFNVPM